MRIEANWDHDYNKDCTPNFINNMGLPRHRWYEFKEGFGGSLVERAISEVRGSQHRGTLTVLDPFSGSGTTPLVSLENNCDSIGIEVNPFMNFVGLTKSSAQKKSSIEYVHQLQWILSQNQIEMPHIVESESTFSSASGKEKWLFNQSVIRGFSALRHHINKVEDADMFMLALYRAVMQCCNAKRDGKCLRYKKNWNMMGYSSLEVRNYFEIAAKMMIADMDAKPLIGGNRDFVRGDSRKKMELMGCDSVDLIVFSPPYLNSFDYSDIYRPEMFLGEYVTSNDELRSIRENTLRSHVQCKWESKDHADSLWVARIAEQIKEKEAFLWSKDIPDMISNYFFDMQMILKEAYRVARKGAQIWFVVATSSYAGVEIPVDLLLADIAVHQGWALKNVNALRKLRTSSQCISDEIRKIRLRESLVICEK